MGSLGRQLGQFGLNLALLPYDAWISLDAIGRTLLRVLITRRRLLEWETSSDTEKGKRAGLGGLYLKMCAVPVLAGTVGAALGWFEPAQLPVALPLLILWMLAPGIAWWISRPLTTARSALTDPDRAFLRRTARKTWFFFETFVNEQEHWLPPDNFQEAPTPVVASRTSPTNMGLALLANLAARDFGYLSEGGLLRRTRDALASMESLERFRGHFYNWYDTRTREPLLPLYVSSVDSGNLAGHLLTLGAGLRELSEEPVYRPKVFDGLRDTLEILLLLTDEHRRFARLRGLLDPPPIDPAGGLRASGRRRRRGEAPRGFAGERNGGPSGAGPRAWFDSAKITWLTGLPSRPGWRFRKNRPPSRDGSDSTSR